MGMCMYRGVHMCTCVCIYMCLCVFTWMCVCAWVWMYTCVYVCACECGVAVLVDGHKLRDHNAKIILAFIGTRLLWSQARTTAKPSTTTQELFTTVIVDCWLSPGLLRFCWLIPERSCLKVKWNCWHHKDHNYQLKKWREMGCGGTSVGRGSHTKPSSIRSIPGSTRWKARTTSYKLSYEFHTCAVASMWTHTHRERERTNKYNAV